MSSVGSNNVPYVVDLGWKLTENNLIEHKGVLIQDDKALDEYVDSKLKPLIESIKNVLDKAEQYAKSNPMEFAIRTQRGEFELLQNGKKEQKYCHVKSLGSVRSRFLVEDADQKLAEIPVNSARHDVLIWVLTKLYDKILADPGAQAAICVSEKIQPHRLDADPIRFIRDFYNTPLFKSMACRCMSQIK